MRTIHEIDRVMDEARGAIRTLDAPAPYRAALTQPSIAKLATARAKLASAELALERAYVEALEAIAFVEEAKALAP